jgi:ankyrin repeat protein
MRPLRKLNKSSNAESSSASTGAGRAAVIVNVATQDRSIEFIKSGNIEALLNMTVEGSSDRAALSKPHTKSGMLPLCVAADEGLADCVEALLAAGLSADAKDQKGMTPLLYAARNGSQKIVDLLMVAQANVHIQHDESRENCLFLACRYNRYALARYFLDEHHLPAEMVNARDETPLWNALKTERFELASLLLAHGADINFRQSATGHTALHVAVFHNRPTALQFVIANGGDILARNASGESALAIACRFGYTELAMTLVQQQQQVSEQVGVVNDDVHVDMLGRSPLSLACLTQKEETVYALLSLQANANHLDRWQYSPLTLLVRQAAPSPALVAALLAAGAEVDQRDNCFRTPLGHACRHGSPHVEVARQLLQAGANPMAVDMDGRSVLDFVEEGLGDGLVEGKEKDQREARLALRQLLRDHLVQQQRSGGSNTPVDLRPQWMHEINAQKEVVNEQLTAMKKHKGK